MTFDDDMAFLMFDCGRMNVSLLKLGLSWPPPEKITVWGFPMKRTRMSTITDEQRAGMTHVCRAAEFVPDAEGAKA